MLSVISSKRWARLPLGGDAMPLGPPSPRVALAVDKGRIVIGLVNNMPDTALRSTERQFRELLSAASRDLTISLRLYSLPEVPRRDAGRLHLNQHYENIAELWSNELDGLIVTGTEPRAHALTDEPYWNGLTKLIDWAEHHTISTIWSCLAAHAAVFHKDGIRRHRFGKKLNGIFSCSRVEEHPILAGAPQHWCAPHSRYNGLSEQELVSREYRILARSPQAGVDIFMKHGRSLFLFFQGHPEYDPGALLREYRRDIGRFLAGTTDVYPGTPQGLLDARVIAALRALRQRALLERGANVLSDVSTVLSEVTPVCDWREAAICIYGNWLSYLAERKRREASPIASVLIAPHCERQSNQPTEVDHAHKLTIL